MRHLRQRPPHGGRHGVPEARDGTGWGFTAGVGYDIRVGRNVSLTPVANFVYGGVGDLNVSGGGAPFATGWKQNVVDFGLGVTFH